MEGQTAEENWIGATFLSYVARRAMGNSTISALLFCWRAATEFIAFSRPRTMDTIRSCDLRGRVLEERLLEGLISSNAAIALSMSRFCFFNCARTAAISNVPPVQSCKPPFLTSLDNRGTLFWFLFHFQNKQLSQPKLPVLTSFARWFTVRWDGHVA